MCVTACRYGSAAVAMFVRVLSNMLQPNESDEFHSKMNAVRAIKMNLIVSAQIIQTILHTPESTQPKNGARRRGSKERQRSHLSPDTTPNPQSAPPEMKAWGSFTPPQSDEDESASDPAVSHRPNDLFGKV